MPVGMQGERYSVTTRAPLPVIALAIARALAEVVLENSRDLGGKDTGPGAWSLDPALGLDLAGNTRGVVAVLCVSCRSRCTSFDV